MVRQVAWSCGSVLYLWKPPGRRVSDEPGSVFGRTFLDAMHGGRVTTHGGRVTTCQARTGGSSSTGNSFVGTSRGIRAFCPAYARTLCLPFSDFVGKAGVHGDDIPVQRGEWALEANLRVQGAVSAFVRYVWIWLRAGPNNYTTRKTTTEPIKPWYARI